jgi:HAAS domain-containing protein
VTAAHADQIIDGYLARLEQALADLPPPRRAELLDDVRTHIAEARRGLADETDADLLNVLDKLGDPADIAADARERLGAQPAMPVGMLEIAAIVALVLVWPAGIALVWLSSTWSQRDKLIATVLFPGAFLGLAMLPTVATPRHWWILVMFLLVTPVVWSIGAIYLAVRLYRTRSAGPKLDTAGSGRVGAMEIAAVVLTPLLWPVGVVLLWTSQAWQTRDKLIGTLLPPGGYIGIIILAASGIGGLAYSGGCVQPLNGPQICSSFGPPDWLVATRAVVGIFVLILPILTAIYLSVRLREGNQVRPAVPA